MFNAEVEQYRKTFEQYAVQYGVEQYVPTLMAIAQQESGGKLPDVMQSSESLGLPPNSLNPDESIEQGTKHFAEVLTQSNNDLHLALQSYNFGSGFIGFVKENGGFYTKDLAVQFSQEMYNKVKDTGNYSCVSDEAKALNACYGDILYVERVMAHMGESGGTETMAVSTVGENFTEMNGVQIVHTATLGDVLIMILLAMILVFQLLSRFIRG